MPQKITLLGDTAVGKTKLLFAMKNQLDTPHRYLSTIGVKPHQIRHEGLSLQFNDTAGQERFESLGDSHLHASNYIIFMFDATNRRSFERLQYYLDKCKTNGAPRILLRVNNHYLDKTPCVSNDEINAFCRDNNCTPLVIDQITAQSAQQVLDVVVNRLKLDKPQLLASIHDNERAQAYRRRARLAYIATGIMLALSITFACTGLLLPTLIAVIGASYCVVKARRFNDNARQAERVSRTSSSPARVYHQLGGNALNMNSLTAHRTVASSTTQQPPTNTAAYAPSNSDREPTARGRLVY